MPTTTATDFTLLSEAEVAAAKDLLVSNQLFTENTRIADMGLEDPRADRPGRFGQARAETGTGARGPAVRRCVRRRVPAGIRAPHPARVGLPPGLRRRLRMGPPG